MVKVRNPLISTRARGEHTGENIGLKLKAEYPEHLQALFAGSRVKETRWTNLVPAFLNFEHSELLLMATPSQDLKIQFEDLARTLANIDENTSDPPQQSDQRSKMRLSPNRQTSFDSPLRSPKPSSKQISDE